MIFNPVMDELFTAEKGGGAWLNDRKRLRVAADIFQRFEHFIGDFECIGHGVSSGYPWRCACRRSAG